MPYIPALLEYEVPMRQLYVAPKIVEKDDKNNSEVRIKTFTDFLMKDGCLCKNIFLVGEPGTGKSIFTQNLALQWSELQLQSVFAEGDTVGESDDDFQDKNTLNMIEFLFHVSLRDANGHCSYADIIRDQLLVHIYNQSELDQAGKLVQCVLECPASCIISDGLDEWSHPEQGQCSCPANMKGRTPVICQPHSAMTITTSRPWRMTQCPPKETKIKKRMEIEGTGNVNRFGEKVVTVLNKRFEKNEHFSEIEKYIQEKNVSHLLTIPILFLQIVCLYFDGKEVSSSQCKLYASMLDMLVGGQPVKNTKQKRKLPQIFANKMNIILNWTFLIKIAQLAFEQLFTEHGHSSVVFDSSVCHFDDKIKKFALSCGILSEKKSKSLSCWSSKLSFLHKSFQEFLAVVHMSLNENLFEKVVEPRYVVNDISSFRRYISDISQIFIFVCGINTHMAEKMSTHISNRLAAAVKDLVVNGAINGADGGADTISEDAEYDFVALTSLMRKGIDESDNNGVTEVRLSSPYISFHVQTDHDLNICKRLVQSNEAQIRLFKVNHTLASNPQVADVLPLPSLKNCNQLKYLTLQDFNLSAQEFQLPDNLTCIKLDNVALTGALNLESLSSLQVLQLAHIDLGGNTLKLPASVNRIDLDHVTVSGIKLENCTVLEYLQLKHIDLGDTKHVQLELNKCKQLKVLFLEKINPRILNRGGLQLKQCVQLNELTLKHINFGTNKLQLPTAISKLYMEGVTLSRRVSLENCLALMCLSLKRIDLGNEPLKLPTSVTDVLMDRITVTGGVFLKDCTKLTNLSLMHIDLGDKTLDGLQLTDCRHLNGLTLKYIDLGHQLLQLSESLFKINMDHVTVSGGVSLENCTRLSDLSLKHIDLKDHKLELPTSINNINLEHVTVSEGISIVKCTELKFVTLERIQIRENTLQLPSTISNINLRHVTASGGISLTNCLGLKVLLLNYVELTDHNLQFSVSLSEIRLDHVNVTGQLSLEKCARLTSLTMIHTNLRNSLQPSASVLCIYMEHVTMRGELLLENCTAIEYLTLKHINLGDHNYGGFKLEYCKNLMVLALEDITHSDLKNGGLQLNNCMNLIDLTLKHIDLGNNSLQLPASIFTLHLDCVTVSGGVLLDTCSVLGSITFKNIDIRRHKLHIPTSVHTICMDHVRVSEGVSLENCTRVTNLTLKNIDLKDHHIRLPASINTIDFDRVTMPGEVHFDNCTGLKYLVLKNIVFRHQTLALPASLSSIYMDHVTVPMGIVVENCMRLECLDLRNIKHGDRELVVPDNISIKTLHNVSK